MDDLQREAEAPVGQLRMRHDGVAGREPGRQPPAPSEQLDKIILAAKDQRALTRPDSERHADAVTNIFFEAGGTRKALGGLHHLRKAAGPSVESRPDLAAARMILGQHHNSRHMPVARERQRPPDRSQGLRPQPAQVAHRGFEHLAGVERGRAVGEALAEAPPDRGRQRLPVLRSHQRAKARVATIVVARATERGFQYRGFDAHEHVLLAHPYLLFPSGKSATMRVPSRISAASFGLGTVNICAYQRSRLSTKLSISLSRLPATGSSARSPSASATQDLSASTAGSSSRSLRTAAIRVAISQRSVSASKCSRLSPFTGTRRIRFQAISSRIEFDTLERASPSVEAISSAVSGRPER